jgi:hypothetical protein
MDLRPAFPFSAFQLFSLSAFSLMSLGSQFRSLATGTAVFRTAVFGEEVTIGSWEGKAAVSTGAIANQEDVLGGHYEKDSFTISVEKTDLQDFVPTPGMNVTARELALRIPDNGIIEYRDRYVITAVSRTSPR